MIEVAALFFAVMLCFTCMVFNLVLLIGRRDFLQFCLTVINAALLAASIKSLLLVSPF